MKPAVRSRLLLLGGAALVLLADQLSKQWVVHTLPEYTTVDVIPWLKPILSFTYVHNTGVAFGLFPQLGGVFTLLSAAVIVALLIFYRTIPVDELWIHLALGLMTGGALGNLLDRLLRGSVVDFLDFNFWPLQSWPIFNVADSAVVVGTTILVLDSLFAMKEESRAPLEDVPQDV